MVLADMVLATRANLDLDIQCTTRVISSGNVTVKQDSITGIAIIGIS